MSDIIDGGSAFPNEQGHCPDGTWNQTLERGMTLRDYFAAAALSSFNVVKGGDMSAYARAAYGLADAMLNEGSKPCHE